MRSHGSTSTRGAFPIFTCASGTTPSRPGASTNRRRPIASSCAPKGSRSRKPRARCRPRSARAGAIPARCSGPMPNMTRCRATRSRSCPTAHRAPGCIRGRRDTPIRTRHWARRRSPESWRRRPRWSGSGCRARIAVLRRAGRKGLRLEAGARRQGLLRRRRRLHLLSPAFHQHRDLGHPVRRLLERGLHLRDGRAGEVDRQEPDPDGRTPRTRRRAAPVRSTRSA